ncbi:type I DNA topoisomerase [Thermosulfuriphilus sp.]
MKKGLVIVESPTKVKTLKKVLGKDYDVRASVGHIKDLPKSRLGVDIDNGFTPQYEIIRGKKKIIEELRRAAKGIEDIYLGPDPDREGEAIAWHIAEELRHKKRRFHRILLYELTERGIKEALDNPVELNRSRYESQQARRILDRLVGYQISPLLWEKVKRGLSAGRVQSVALRIICEREREIQAFVPEEYWTVSARLSGQAGQAFMAKAISRGEEKLKIKNESEALAIVGDLEDKEFVVSEVKRKQRRRKPAPPFITSTLQQEAYRKLRFPARKTMVIAQRLYEGIDLGPQGPVGLITYMRTDSTRTAPEAIAEVRSFIKETFGGNYLPDQPHTYKSRAGAQEAHEAIRPTSVYRTPEQVAPYLSKEELALYELIWKRFVASQMAPAQLEQTTIEIKAGEYGLRATGTVIIFPGFMSLYVEAKDSEEEVHQLPPVKEAEKLELLELIPKQHFTQPPPRYTEASLIKALEEKGIGRPSTYATIISTIKERNYVRQEKSQLRPTELGLLVNELLVSHFPDIINVEFTARMEEALDRIEEGEASRLEVLKKFYETFAKELETAQKKMASIKKKGLATDVNCPSCGSPMVIRIGRAGEFLVCSRYPECQTSRDFTRDDRGQIKIIEPEEKEVGVCEKCGRPMVIKRSRFGEFLACSGYPECKNVRPISTGVPCPEPGCTGELVKRRTRRGKIFYSCSRYPDCRYALWDEPVAKSCPSCQAPLMVIKRSKREGLYLKCLNKECGHREPYEEPDTGSEGAGASS